MQVPFQAKILRNGDRKVPKLVTATYLACATYISDLRKSFLPLVRQEHNLFKAL